MRETPRDDRTTPLRDERSREPFHTRATEVPQTGKQTESIPELLKDLTTESRELLRKEVELAKAEMSESVSRLGRQAASMAVGGGILLAALIVLLGAVSAGATSLMAQFIDAEIAVWLAPLIVAVVLAFIGYSMIKAATESMRHTHLTPDKAIREAKQTKDWAKEKARHG